MLEIPHIGRVPRVWTLHRAGSPVMLHAALALLDRGLIPTASPVTETPAALVQAGLKRWLDAQTAGMRFFSFTLDFTEGNESSALITLRSTCHGHFTIGKRITQLQNAVRGLGETVLWWITRVTCNRFPICLPETALQIASWNYWNGMRNEEEFLRELKLNGESPDAIEFLTRAEFDRHIPRWASEPKRRIQTCDLENLAGVIRPAHCRQICNALLDLIGANENNRGKTVLIRDELDRVIIFPPAVILRWSANDVMLRILDDFYNELNETGEFRESFADIGIENPAAMPDRLAEFIAGSDPFFAILRALDALLTLIAGARHG